MAETIGFIGLGNMGSAMASRMQQAGYSLVVHDLREGAVRPFQERGARVAGSPEEVARHCAIVFTSLPGPREVEEVAVGARGILRGIKEGSVYVDFSTSRPSLIRQIGALFREKGAYVLDAPVSGGAMAAARGKQEVMVSGDAAAYERIRPAISTFADQIVYVGDLGAGTIAKLVHNMIQRGVAAVLAEGFALGVKAGVEPQTLWDCVRRGLAGRMSTLHESMPRTVFRGTFEPATYTLALARKDLGLATELGREYGVPMPLANLVEQIAIAGMNRGWGDQSPAVLFRLQEEVTGVEVRAPEVDPEKAARYLTVHPEE